MQWGAAVSPALSLGERLRLIQSVAGFAGFRDLRVGDDRGDAVEKILPQFGEGRSRFGQAHQRDGRRGIVDFLDATDQGPRRRQTRPMSLRTFGLA
jgi:hypothetical protein